jgi:hypothetical protein
VADTVPLTIGSSDSGTYGFQGLIDEAAIYNRALSAAEIQSIFNVGSISSGSYIIGVSPPSPAPAGGRANPPLIPNTPARIPPAWSASPGGELNSVDSFFALVNRKDSALASQADSAVGSGETNAPVAALFSTQFRLDGAAFGVANHTTRKVDELPAVNKQAVKGLLDSGDATLQAQAAELFHALNQAAST